MSSSGASTSSRSYATTRQEQIAPLHQDSTSFLVVEQRSSTPPVDPEIEQRSRRSSERSLNFPARRPSYADGLPIMTDVRRNSAGSTASTRVRAGELWRAERSASPRPVSPRSPTRGPSASPRQTARPLADSNSRRAPPAPICESLPPSRRGLSSGPCSDAHRTATAPVSPTRATPQLSPAKMTPPVTPTSATLPPAIPAKSVRRRSRSDTVFPVEGEHPSPSSLYHTAPNTVVSEKGKSKEINLPTPVGLVEKWAHLRPSRPVSPTSDAEMDSSEDELPSPRVAIALERPRRPSSSASQQTPRSLPRSLPRSPPPWSNGSPPIRSASEGPPAEMNIQMIRRSRSAYSELQHSRSRPHRPLSMAQKLGREADRLSEDPSDSDVPQVGRSPRRRHQSNNDAAFRSSPADGGNVISRSSPPPVLTPIAIPIPGSSSPPAPQSPTRSPKTPKRKSRAIPSPPIKMRGSSLSSYSADSSAPTSPQLDHADSIASSSMADSSHYATPESTPSLRPQESEDVLLLAPELTETLSEGSKRKRTRVRAIQELITTEWTYAQDLAIARDVYYARAHGAPISEIADHLTTSPDFVPPPTPAMTAHGFISLGSSNRRRSFVASPALQATSTFSPAASTKSLSSSVTPDMPVFSPSDVKLVFLNLTELAEFGAAFSGLLDAAAGSALQNQENGQDDRIGEEFVRMIPRIQQLYSAYCSRHGAALQRLEELESALTVYLNECQDLCRTLTHSWSLGSLLIKPVQRCLKYPLLIETILANTPEAHPDRANLELALEKMLAVAQEMNEAKRRNEVIERVVRKRGKLFGRKANGSNFSQTMGKKFMRSGYRVRQAAGFEGPVFVDEEEASLLDTLVSQFEARQSDLDALALHTRSWLSAWTIMLHRNRSVLKAWLALYEPLEGEADVQGGGRDTVYACRRLYESIDEGPLDELAVRLHARVFPVLNRVDPLFQGPRAIILKRASKRVDYERATRQTTDRSALEGRDIFLALSRALAEELPVFLNAVARIIDTVALELAAIQTAFYRSLHAALFAYERSHCSRFDGSEDVVKTWRQLVGPLHAALENLECTRSRLLVHRAESAGAARSSWRASDMSIDTSSSSPSRTQSAPGVSVESLVSHAGGHQRHATAETVPNRHTLHQSRSFTSWLRTKPARTPLPPPSPSSPDELASIRRFFATGATPPSSASTPVTPVFPSGSGSSVSVIQSTLPVQHMGRAIRGVDAGRNSEGQVLLPLRAGENVSILWEAGDGWAFARSEVSGLEGFAPTDALVVLPAGAG